MKEANILIGDNTPERGIKWACGLKDAGFFAVTRESNGRVIFDTLKKGLPTFLVLNAKMPELDAVELLTKMKKELGRIPKTVVIGNCASEQLENEVTDAGACYFMVQPFTPEQFVKKMESLYSFYCRYAADTDENVEYVATEILQRMSVPANLKGYHYVRRAIVLSVTNPIMQESITKQLYPTVAKEFRTTSSRVERTIRHAIEHAWAADNGETMSVILGNSARYLHRKPTNSEFIAIIADKLRLKYFRKAI